MLKKQKCNIIAFYTITAIALITALFVDLKLDIFLNNPNDLFSIWFQWTGETPGRILVAIAGAVLFYTYKNRFEQIIGFILAIGGGLYFGDYYFGRYFFQGLSEDIATSFDKLYGLGIGVICLVVGYFIKIPEDKRDIIRKTAIVGIIALLVQVVAIEGVKYLWGRVRFRDLLKAGSYDAFTSWLHPNGINGNKSFPSGHTAGAGMSYLMMFLPYISDKLKKHPTVCFIVPFVYTSIVAYTRLVMGAHYLSDVAMGGAISFTIVIVAMKIFEKRIIK